MKFNCSKCLGGRKLGPHGYVYCRRCHGAGFHELDWIDCVMIACALGIGAAFLVVVVR